jgi:hypothetical protein
MGTVFAMDRITEGRSSNLVERCVESSFICTWLPDLGCFCQIV